MQCFSRRILRTAALAAVALALAASPALAQHKGGHGGGDHHGGDYHHGGGDYHHSGFSVNLYGFDPGIYFGWGNYGYRNDYNYGYRNDYRYRSFDYWPAMPAEMPATVVVRVPADAMVWFDGIPTQSSGEMRTFGTPPLSVGSVYHYDIRAQWSEKGATVDRSQRVDVFPGRTVVVDFSR